MEDQIVHVDKEQERLSDAEIARKLYKKERRLAARLEDAREAEARAQDRFQRAEVRLQRRRARLERITNNLLLVQKQIADAHITDQQPGQEAIPESEALSSSHAESIITGTGVSEQEAAPINADFSDGLAASGGEQGEDGWGHPTPRQGTSSPAPLVSTSLEDTPTSAGLSHTFSASGGEQGEDGWGHLAPWQGTSAPAPLTSIPMETLSTEADSSQGLAAVGSEQGEIEQGYPMLQQETLAPAPLTSEAMVDAPTSVGAGHASSTSDGEPGGYLAPWQGTSAPVPLTSEPVETIPAEAGSSQVLATFDGEQGENGQGHFALRQETSAPAPLTSIPMETTLESEGSSSASIEHIAPAAIEQEAVARAVEVEVDATPEVDTSPESSMEREPTKPLRLEQEDQPAAGSLSPEVQSAKEAWVAAESAVQHARNTAHGIAASISFLSQTSGFSDKFMTELVYKQAEANKALVKAQDASRLAYEKFVQAQEHAVSQPVDVSVGGSEDQTRQMQENGALPEVEDNANDQTVSMHAIRLYKPW